ncbi:MAG: hydroxymethylglutaryl-CoA lyase [marine bacterium B5-7]|nr:MAG: hydroxymethylglutaryl-CoA lyase [marine bacterium B5-7]
MASSSAAARPAGVYPTKVRIVEVGPRDGLQNESAEFSTQTRIELVRRLLDCGLKAVEAGSFVSPRWVPKMADTGILLEHFDRSDRDHLAVLVPNLRGLEAAIESGATEIAVFGAASETFSAKNINCSIAESLERFRPVCSRALAEGLRVRGYVSCVLGCPYEGDVDPDRVADVSEQLIKMGCYEVSLGDTIGTGTPLKAVALIRRVTEVVPVTQLAVHFHDTYGQALVNIFAALGEGISVIDSSVAGLGGCPYAPGAAGNVATEDVIYMLDGMGIQHGIDFDRLLDTAGFILNALDKQPVSRVSTARLAKAKS